MRICAIRGEPKKKKMPQQQLEKYPWDAMRAVEKANFDTLFGIFGDASWTSKNRLRKSMPFHLSSR